MTTRIASPYNALAVGLYLGAAVQGLLHVLGVASANAMIDLFNQGLPGSGDAGRGLWALLVMGTAITAFIHSGIRSVKEVKRWSAIRVEMYAAWVLAGLFGFYWWTLAATTTVDQVQTTKIFALTLTLPPVARAIQILVELTKAGMGAARQVRWFRSTRAGQALTIIRHRWGARRTSRRG